MDQFVPCPISGDKCGRLSRKNIAIHVRRMHPNASYIFKRGKRIKKREGTALVEGKGKTGQEEGSQEGENVRSLDRHLIKDNRNGVVWCNSCMKTLRGGNWARHMARHKLNRKPSIGDRFSIKDCKRKKEEDPMKEIEKLKQEITELKKAMEEKKEEKSTSTSTQASRGRNPMRGRGSSEEEGEDDSQGPTIFCQYCGYVDQVKKVHEKKKKHLKNKEQIEAIQAKGGGIFRLNGKSVYIPGKPKPGKS